MNLGKVIAQYNRNRNLIEKKIERKKAELAKLQNQFVDFKTAVLHPFVKYLADQLKAKSYSISGPCGIDCAYILDFKSGRKCYTLTVIRGFDDDLYVKNVAVDTGEYAQGTIGALNGLNNPSIKIPAVPTLKWLKPYIYSFGKSQLLNK